MDRRLGLVTGVLLACSGASGADYNPPSPVPLPIAKVTIPSITPVKIQTGGFLSVL
jgi:hypothetical protein